MTRNRLEAFSDAVIAILITIMVLELAIPHHDKLVDLWELRLPVFLSYVAELRLPGHLLEQPPSHAAPDGARDGGVLWANMHLLFWLSLVPFATAWMGENSFAETPTAIYGVVLLMAAIAYYVLVRVIIRSQGRDSLLARAIGNDFKGRLSVVLYATAIVLALWAPLGALAIYGAVAAIWLVPDRRIEKVVLACEDERRAEGRADAGE